MKVYSYIVSRDFGFAPNPFGGFCTLSTCKPLIRKNATLGDWVIGTGAKGKYGIPGTLLYAMRVDEKISFDDYWTDPRFQFKKPIFNGSLKQCFGDNIYVQKEGKWNQSFSHHSNVDGSINDHNLKRDTRWPNTLISHRFYYFGENYVEIPENLKDDVCKKMQGHKIVADKPAMAFLKWLETNFTPAIHGDPLEFSKGFRHYDGIS
ncbi:hypothetical protein [uncultured Croceitalea sp.]|uniref:Nmad2 family putative nucleotide modification protein n=1 Tax=uncultured Croceitalea sp. TaxID=1798908 RepID=UPI003305EB1A